MLLTHYFYCSFHGQARCENILRSHPENTLAIELHLACIEAAEREDEKKVKQIATVGSTAVAVIGVAAGVAGMMMKKRQRSGKMPRL